MGKKKRSISGQASASVAVATEIRQMPGSRIKGFPVSEQSKPNFLTSRYFEWLAVGIASVVSYWILTARVVGVNVSVLVDEYLYVLDSHYKSLAEAVYPNHLFQLVYRVTKQCGPEFYSCARGLNAIFIVGGALFLYLLAKHIAGKKWVGAAVGLAAVLGSYGTYAAYFMPEAIFNFPMIVFFWALIRFGKTDNLFAWLGFGLIIGIASLAKPHAFFVLPAVVIFTILLQRGTKDKYLLPSLLKAGATLTSFFTTKFLFGFVISGDRGLSVLGNYASLPQAGGLATEALVKNNGLSVIGTSWGQTLMITMIVGVALAVAVHGLLTALPKNPPGVFMDFSARALIGLSLLNMMAVSAIFEAWGNLDVWMHTRYYSYLIPLSIVVLVEAYARSSAPSRPLLRKIVVAIFLVVATTALITAALPYGANWIDAPDFKFHIDNTVISSILIIVSIVLAIWWVWDNKIPMLAAIMVSVFAAVMAGSYTTNFMYEKFGKDSTYDQLARVLWNYLPQVELDQTILIGDDSALTARVLFGTMSGGATSIQSGEEDIPLESLDPEIRWLVNVGDAGVSGLPSPLITGPTYKIYSLKSDNSLIPRNNDLSSMSNLCVDSATPGWSCGATTLVSFAAPVPALGEVDLIFEVSEQASAGELDFVLGESTLRGTFPQGIYSLTLSFTNASAESEMIIQSNALLDYSTSEEIKSVRIVSANINR
jgi:hypothetical protein